MFQIFLKDKPSRILLILKDTNAQWHLSKIARDTGTTYVYVTKFITLLRQKELVSIEPKGKKRIVKLTEKGFEVANLVDELKKKLGI
ncbi:hypothetical protein HZC07_00215 [Candidatus Micrarchaeota archaeon]|nr:hypothetical protein [Candidatus Micrarchaeota archaeon]